VSKAAVLQRSIDCIHQMESAKKAQEGELTELKKEVVALQIMRTNYEKLVQSHKVNKLALTLE
jgi:MAX-like protein X